MKIVVLIHHFPPRYHAGAEQYAYRLGQGLIRHGHSVEIVCLESIAQGTLAPRCETAEYDGLLVHRLFFDLNKAPNLFEWSFRNPELGRWLEDFLRRSSPDLLHVNSGYLLGGTVFEAAHALGIPTVLTLHDFWFLCPLNTLLRTSGRICDRPVPPARCVWCFTSQKRRYGLPDRALGGRLGDAFVAASQFGPASALLRIRPQTDLMAERVEYLSRVLQTVGLVISPSRFLMDKMLEYGLSHPRMVHLPFGLDQIKVLPARGPRPTGPLRFGYMGQFAPHKGVDLLLAAFQKLGLTSDRAQLSLHGNIRPDVPYHRQLLHAADGNPAIIFTGPFPNSEVGRVLAGLDSLVVPSIWYENRPTVIVEAQASRVPVVATRLGGMAELVRHDQNGLLFDVGSVDGLAVQMQRLIDEPDLLSRLCAGIEPVPTLDQEIAALVGLYQSLV